MRFAPPSRMVTRGGVGPSAVSSNVETDYPLTNLHDGTPTEVTRWTTNGTQRITWDQASAIPVDGFLLVMHTFAAGATVKVQANATDSWGNPSFSQDIVVPSWTGGTSQWLLPTNLVADFRLTSLGSTGYRYLSVLMPAQSANHAVGEIVWVKSWMEPQSSITWPVTRSEIRRVNVNSTSYGIEHVVDRKVHQRRLTLGFRAISSADRDMLLALVREVGASESFALVLDVAETDFHASSEALLVRMTAESVADFQESLQFFDVHDISMEVIEVQRGLAL